MADKRLSGWWDAEDNGSSDRLWSGRRKQGIVVARGCPKAGIR